MNRTKIIVITILLALSAVILTGCVAMDNYEDGNHGYIEQVTPSQNQEQVEEGISKDVLEQIRKAKKVTITERFISFGKAYDISIDGKEVATVSGNFIHITGDVFKLEDKSGNLLAQEKQIKRWGVKLNRLAHVMDRNGNTTGYIGENVIKDFFSISKYKFHFYDSNKNEYAHTKEKILSLLYEFEVYNNNDKEIYKIRENFNLFVDEYEITKTSDSNVNMDDVIFLTCIVDAIRDSEKD